VDRAHTTPDILRHSYRDRSHSRHPQDRPVSIKRRLRNLRGWWQRRSPRPVMGEGHRSAESARGWLLVGRLFTRHRSRQPEWGLRGGHSAEEAGADELCGPRSLQSVIRSATFGWRFYQGCVARSRIAFSALAASRRGLLREAEWGRSPRRTASRSRPGVLAFVCRRDRHVLGTLLAEIERK
jgi:hypothetical protein